MKHNNESSLDYIHLYANIAVKYNFPSFFLVEEGVHKDESSYGPQRSKGGPGSGAPSRYTWVFLAQPPSDSRGHLTLPQKEDSGKPRVLQW